MVEEKKKPYYVWIASTAGATIGTIIAYQLKVTDPGRYVQAALGGSFLLGIIVIGLLSTK